MKKTKKEKEQTSGAR